jgi:hypothetical protein
MTRLVQLQGFVILCAAALLLVLPGESESGGKDKSKPAPPPKSTRWQWKVTEGDKKVDEGTFKGYTDGSIRWGKDQINVGSWKFSGGGKDAITATFTFARLKGSWNVKLITPHPPVWEGTCATDPSKTIRIEMFGE